MIDTGIWINLAALVILYTAITLMQRGKKRRLSNMQSTTRKIRYNPSDLQPGVHIANWKLASIAFFFILFGVLGRLLGYFPPQAMGYWWIGSVIGILMLIFSIK